MTTVRIAVASTPLTATLDEAVPAAISAIEEAFRQGAAVVCLPEAAIPGHRSQARQVPAFTQAQLDGAMDRVAAAARRAGVVAIVGTERVTPRGREIVSVVVGPDGRPIGTQPKTQIDLSEEADYVPGSGRRTFTAGGLTFGIAICHEAFRYPEITRSLALAGARVVFVPHYVTTDDGTLPARWCDAGSPYNEKALLCRALESTVYIAQANVATPDQGSATCVVAPDGTWVAGLPYGVAGVAVAEVDLERADGLIARRWAPARSLVGAADDAEVGAEDRGLDGDEPPGPDAARPGSAEG